MVKGRNFAANARTPNESTEEMVAYIIEICRRTSKNAPINKGHFFWITLRNSATFSSLSTKDKIDNLQN
jgi:hypothetical protein